jgi:hypothetical protein
MALGQAVPRQRLRAMTIKLIHHLYAASEAWYGCFTVLELAAYIIGASMACMRPLFAKCFKTRSNTGKTPIINVRSPSDTTVQNSSKDSTLYKEEPHIAPIGEGKEGGM